MQCGLDRSKKVGDLDIEEQASVMLEQVNLAKELERPVSVRNPEESFLSVHIIGYQRCREHSQILGAITNESCLCLTCLGTAKEKYVSSEGHREGVECRDGCKGAMRRF